MRPTRRVIAEKYPDASVGPHPGRSRRDASANQIVVRPKSPDAAGRKRDGGSLSMIEQLTAEARRP